MMKVTIDLENDSASNLELISLEIGKALIEKLKNDERYSGMFKYFDKKEVTYSELCESVNDRNNLDKFILYLKKTSYVLEKRKGVFVKI